MASNSPQQPGGFLLPSLPSPPPSAASTSGSMLPTPRTHALQAGGSKESALRSFVDNRLLYISGCYERRFEADEVPHPNPKGVSEATGYRSFVELAADLEPVIDVIWVSGTPTLQIPFLLNIALAVTDYITSFAFAPRATLQLLQRLDYAFSSLIHGQDVATGDPLPGFETGRRVTTTEKIRLRGLVERTRVRLVDVSRGEAVEDESRGEFQDLTSADETEDESMGYPVGEEDFDLDVARVYERTLADLGDTLGASQVEQ